MVHLEEVGVPSLVGLVVVLGDARLVVHVDLHPVLLGLWAAVVLALKRAGG